MRKVYISFDARREVVLTWKHMNRRCFYKYEHSFIFGCQRLHFEVETGDGSLEFVF